MPPRHLASIQLLAPVLTPLLPCAIREKKRLQCGDTPTDDTNVGLYSCPYPNVEAFPGDIVGSEERIVNPVRSERAGDNNNSTESEKDDETDPLRHWKR